MISCQFHAILLSIFFSFQITLTYFHFADFLCFQFLLEFAGFPRFIAIRRRRLFSILPVFLTYAIYRFCALLSRLLRLHLSTPLLLFISMLFFR